MLRQNFHSIIIIISITFTWASAQESQAIDPPRNAALRICVSADGKDRVGTITFAEHGDRQILITNCHVVKNSNNIQLFYSADSLHSLELSNVVEPTCLWNGDCDLVVFFVSQSGKEELAKLGFKPVTIAGHPAVGTLTTLIGNPGIIFIEDGKGIESRPFNYASSATLSTRMTYGDLFRNQAQSANKDTEMMMLESLGATYGFSGGPVLLHPSAENSPYRLVGILQGGDKAVGNQKKCWAIPANYITDMLAASDKYRKTIDGFSREIPFTQESYFDESGTLEQRFPMKIESKQTVDEGLSCYMTTKIELNHDGILQATTILDTTSVVGHLLGFEGKVDVFVCDGSDAVLWQGKEQTFKITPADGRWVLDNGRRVFVYEVPFTWKDQKLPANIMPYASSIRVYQRKSSDSLKEAKVFIQELFDN